MSPELTIVLSLAGALLAGSLGVELGYLFRKKLGKANEVSIEIEDAIENATSGSAGKVIGNGLDWLLSQVDDPYDPAIQAIYQLELTRQALQLMDKILPQTSEYVTPDKISDASEAIITFMKKFVDGVAGNVVVSVEAVGETFDHLVDSVADALKNPSGSRG